MTGHISGAHLNPAVTLSLAVNNPTGCPADIVAPYIAAQCAGATVAVRATCSAQHFFAVIFAQHWFITTIAPPQGGLNYLTFR